MGEPVAKRPSIAEIRRGAAVGERGLALGLAWVPGVVLADVLDHDPEGSVWMPQGHVVARVWGGEGPAVWQAVRSSPFVQGLQVTVEVMPVTRWARVRAWWRWTLHRLERALGARGTR